jgi:hypothetical protein
MSERWDGNESSNLDSAVSWKECTPPVTAEAMP